MSVVVEVQFHGTLDESRALVEALQHNCDCVLGPLGGRISTCTVHDALISDQRFLDGLIYERRRCALHFPNARNRVIHATEAPHAQ